MRWMLWTVMAGLTLAPAAGCSDDGGEQMLPPNTQSVQMPSVVGDHTAIEQALAKLSPEDRALAEKQKVCLVSGEPLGSMGVPEKVEVHGRPVFICCDSCLEELNENPDEYLKKLPAATQ